MPVIGFHASHEQIHPADLLDAVQRRRAGGLHRGDVLGPLQPVERAAGPLGVRLVLARRRAAGHRACRSAWSTRPASATTRRSSPRRSARWARCTRAGSGPRSAPARPPTSTSPATRWPRKELRNARLLECVDVIRALLAGEEVSHDGLVTVDRARLWTRPETPPPADRRRGQRRDRRLGRRLGRRAGHHRPAARPAAADDRRLPRRPAATGPLVLPGAPELRRRRGGGPRHRARPVAQQRLRSAGLLGPGPRRGLRRGRREGPAGGHASRPCSSPPTRARTPTWLHELVDLGFDEIYLHHVGQQQDRFIEVFGEHVLPQLDVTAKAAPMRITDTSDLWWKTAVIYCLDVETFMDWNDDGVGDFPGLTQRLDYLAALGVTCLWLMPFYPTPGPRRRLRHHRLLRRRPAARHTSATWSR